MYARMSRARIRPGHKAEVEALMAALTQQLHESPGLKYMSSVITEDGELVVMGFFASKEAARNTLHVNTRRWTDAAALFSTNPVVSEGEVVTFVDVDESV